MDAHNPRTGCLDTPASASALVEGKGGVPMRGHRRVWAAVAGTVAALAVASSALGASPWLSIRQQGVSAISQHVACVERGHGTSACEAEILQVFHGKLKISGIANQHADQVCYQKVTATVDTDSGELLEGRVSLGCGFDTGTIRVRNLSSITLAATSIDLLVIDCDETGCSDEIGVGQATLKAKWTGIGRATPSRGRFRIDDGTCIEVEAMRARVREATFSGTVNGAAIAADVALVGAGTFRFRSSCLIEAP
jgi:hypothetical protein